MAVDAQATRAAHRLIEKIGPDAAATLMELVPPVGWADVATKQDLSHTAERLEARFNAKLEERLNSQTKTLVGTLIALNASLAALAFAAARLN